MNYVDGCIIPVPTEQREAFRAYAIQMAALFKEKGALSVVDCWGDDVPEGKWTSFPMAVKREPNETVVFSWITWSSRAARDEAWKVLMADPRMQPGAVATPFDGKRMIFGGFELLQQT
jgi:uncharacterized protein YbaA (DUF1428 family)